MSTPALGTHILCLHYVRRPGEGARRLALEPAQLRALVQRQLDAGRRAIALDDPALGAPDTFALSFDDAHRSVLTEALPLLRALGLTATLFVPTAWVGTSDEWLTWDELALLASEGWLLGSHTVTHPRMGWRLYDETDAQHRARLGDECERSRATMASRLGAAPTLFAYPFGEAPEAAREAALAAGYTRAFTVQGDCAWDGDSMRIPRVDALEDGGLVAPCSDEPTRFSVVLPVCDRAAMLGEVVKRLARQSYPAERFEVLVVDDGSREDLRAALTELPEHFTLLERAGEEGVFRAGQARQRGADAARFEHLVFLDGDVVVGQDFLWHLDWVHRRVPGAVVLGYLSGYNLHDLGYLHTLESVRDVGDPERELPIVPDRSREPALRAVLDNVDWLPEPWRLAYTGNLSLPRALLARIGGFASDFTGWGLEDLDLGQRLARAGAPFVFSRFAVGWHLVDPSESAPRNPFRVELPTRAHFEGYLRNLATLVSHAPDDPAMQRYRLQTLADIDETCGRPDTVGLELGGTCSLACAHHRALNRCQPGGTSVHEALDRLAYAVKVGARALYLLGGEPAEHPAFLALLRRARGHGLRLSCESNGGPCAVRGLAREARAAGLTQVVLKVYAFDSALYEATTRTPGSYARFLRGLDALREAGVYCSAQLVVDNKLVTVLDATLEALAARELRLDEVRTLAPVDAGAVRAALAARGLGAVQVRPAEQCR